MGAGMRDEGGVSSMGVVMEVVMGVVQRAMTERRCGEAARIRRGRRRGQPEPAARSKWQWRQGPAYETGSSGAASVRGSPPWPYRGSEVADSRAWP